MKINIFKKQKLKVALSLQGGGAKCCVYLGMFKAFEENNIPIDAILGSSAGAIIGAAYALGYSIEEIKEKLKDFTLKEFLSWHGIKKKEIIDHDKAISWTIEHFGDNKMSDTKIPFYAFVTNLNGGVVEIIESGNLNMAVLASSAIPGITDPYEIDGKYYGDGDFASGFGTEFLRSNGFERVFGAHIETPIQYPHSEHFVGTNLLERANVSYSVAKTALLELDSKCNPLDFKIKFKVQNVGLFQFDRVDEIAEYGYRITMDRMEEIKSVMD